MVATLGSKDIDRASASASYLVRYIYMNPKFHLSPLKSTVLRCGRVETDSAVGALLSDFKTYIILVLTVHADV